MKTKLSVLIVLLLCCYSTFGQTIPYNFQTPRIPDAKEVQDAYQKRLTDTVVTSAKAYGKVKAYFAKRAISPYYNGERKRVEKVKERLQTAIKAEYTTKKANKQTEIDNAQNVEEAVRLKGELDVLVAEEESKLSDLIKLDHIAKEYNYRSRTARAFNLFHVWYAADAQVHYNHSVADETSKFLNNTLISYNPQGNTVSIFNEIYADYFGPFRLGFGALLADGEEQDENTSPNSPPDAAPSQKDAVQRLLGGGGNAIVNVSYPFFDLRSRSGHFNWKMAFVPKSAVDLPAIGTESGDYSFHLNTGIEGSIFYTGLLKQLTLFSNFRFAKVDGNKNFYRYLGKENRDAFWFNQISGGLAISSTFRLSYNYYYGSKFSNETLPYNVSLAIIPKK